MKTMSNQESILWLDSGLEVTSPFKNHVIDVLRKQGHISATQARYETSPAQSIMLQDLYGVDIDQKANGSRYCAGGFQGFVMDSPAYHKILIQSVTCALRQNCIDKMKVSAYVVHA